MTAEESSAGAVASAQPSKRPAHPYHMYDAILQQPECVARLLDTQRAPIESAADAAATRRRLVLVGIGTSYHAAQIAEHFLRHLSAGRACALVEQSFELVHYPFALSAEDAVIAVSHRGWKNYSVQALRAAKSAGALAISVTGRDAGEGMKAADFVIPTCEQEVSFAHTKSYTTALAALAALVLGVAERQGFRNAAASGRIALQKLREAMQEALGCEPQAREAASQIARRQRLIFVGAGPNWATARSRSKRPAILPRRVLRPSSSCMARWPRWTLAQRWSRYYRAARATTAPEPCSALPVS